MNKVVFLNVVLIAFVVFDVQAYAREAVKADMPGRYLFIAEDSGFPHSKDELMISGDGTYELKQVGPDGKVLRGKWSFDPSSSNQLTLGKAGFPVSLKQGHSKVLIDQDRSFFYEKAP